MEKDKRKEEILKRVSEIDAALREAEDRDDRQMILDELV